MKLILPYPPSVNTYWMRGKNGTFLSKKGREFRKLVVDEHKGNHETITDFVRLDIEVYLPDRRKRDLDNILKPLLDSLEHSAILEDDYLVAEIHIIRKGIEKPGRVELNIGRIE